jgi:hypothetical protein
MNSSENCPQESEAPRRPSSLEGLLVPRFHLSTISHSSTTKYYPNLHPTSPPRRCPRVREARERRIGEKAFFEPEPERAIYTFNFSYSPGVCKMIEARGKKRR